MEFSQVFVLLCALFAISFAVPMNWEESDEVRLASNDKALQEKRFITAAAGYAAKKALGAALNWACGSDWLPSNMRGLCKCAAAVGSLFGDEEEYDEIQRRWLFSESSLETFKSTVISACNNSIVRALVGGVCDCVTSFF